MDVYQILLVLGISFVVFNVFSLVFLFYVYGRRILATMRLPASLKQPLHGHKHELVSQDPTEFELSEAVKSASV